ncbi:MAG TPA: hypothetical protein DGT21_14040 [Armatimonadetes bacterium]|nr:hypothetical protein [Armatimonadota bacterium]
MMKTWMMVVTIVGIAAIASSLAIAQGDAAGEQGGPANEDGLHGRLGPRANAGGGQAAMQRGMRGGMQGNAGRGSYVEVNETTEALWKQIGELKTQQHEAQWELFVALNQEGATRETVAPQLEKLRGLNEQMAALNEQLEPYRKQLARPEGAREGRQGRQGRQGGDGQRGNRGAEAAQGQAL